MAAGSTSPEATCLNLYRPPRISSATPIRRGRWVDHFRKIYPNDADHIIAWLAQRVQHPEIKINHALVLSGTPGIGKDTLLEPVKYTVGAVELPRGFPQAADRQDQRLRQVGDRAA